VKKDKSYNIDLCSNHINLCSKCSRV